MARGTQSHSLAAFLREHAAHLQRLEAVKYIARQGDPEAAQRWLSGLQRAVQSLSDWSRRAP